MVAFYPILLHLAGHIVSMHKIQVFGQFFFYMRTINMNTQKDQSNSTRNDPKRHSKWSPLVGKYFK